MVSRLKKVFFYLNLIINHGISISTILNSKHSSIDKL